MKNLLIGLEQVNRVMFKIFWSVALSVIMLWAVVPMVMGEIDVNPRYKDDKTALHLAFDTDGDPVQEMRKLLELGADVNARDGEYGATSLHYAGLSGSFYAGQALLESGADVDIQDNYGRTPLHSAIKGESRMLEVVPKNWTGC